jgi:hypothetical protein
MSKEQTGARRLTRYSMRPSHACASRPCALGVDRSPPRTSVRQSLEVTLPLLCGACLPASPSKRRRPPAVRTSIRGEFIDYLARFDTEVPDQERRGLNA